VPYYSSSSHWLAAAIRWLNKNYYLPAPPETPGFNGLVPLALA
jgi:hypothetical protein